MATFIHNRRATKSTIWDVIAMLTLALRSVFRDVGKDDEIRKLIKKLEGQMVGR